MKNKYERAEHRKQVRTSWKRKTSMNELKIENKYERDEHRNQVRKSWK